MNKITLSSKDAVDLWQSEVLGNYEVADQIYQGEWRWGNIYDVVIRDIITDKFYLASLKEQSGDHYHVSWEDYDVTFEEVEKVEKISYEYKKVKS